MSHSTVGPNLTVPSLVSRQNALRYRFRGCIVWAFGSSVSGLGFRGCDLDLYALIDPNIAHSGLPRNADQAQKVREVGKLLSRQPHLCTKVVRIPSARVPIVKFRVPPMGHIQCDLNFKDRLSCQNSRLIGMLMKTGQCHDERARQSRWLGLPVLWSAILLRLD